jgi:pimeloyl-ACP methyl ester carboxylesterase
LGRLFAPGDTPGEIVSKLTAAAVEALADPGVRSHFADFGTEVLPPERQTPQPLGALVKAEAKTGPIPSADSVTGLKRQEATVGKVCKIVLCAATAMVLASLAARAEDPVLRIAKQGSMEAGGRAINCATNDGGDPNSRRFPSGHVVVDNVYATFQYPADQRYPYPILFNSGGGHTARVYDTTPDGREGWLTLFMRQGFPVYGVDRTNTGRSGTDICKINAVKLGKAPPAELPAINRYAAESSWVTFRWGPKFGEPYTNTQFPIAFADAYYPQMISTYRDPVETPKSVAAFAALIDKIAEPVIIQSWSSSGLLGYLTAIERSERVKGILAVETSVTAFDMIPAEGRQKLAKIPIYIVIGDHAEDRVEASRKFQKEMAAIGGHVTVDVLPEAGIYGNGHTMMLEKNNKQIMYRMIAWLEGNVFEPK